MTDMSQSIKDVVKGAEKWKSFAVDAPLGERAKVLFEGSKSFDPRIYKGESRAYSRNEIYESSLDVQKRMAEKSDNLKDWIGNQRYDIGSNLPPDRRGYSFGRDTAGNFEDVAKQYLMGEGKELYQHLKGKGREFYDITRIGSADLEGAVAGLAVYGNEAALIGSKDFDAKVSQLASQYGVSNARAKSYVFAHELVHASQKGLYGKDNIKLELDVEHTLKEYFSAKGEHDLAAIAGDRAANVTSNYSSLGTYASPAASIGKYSSAKYASPAVSAGKAGYAAKAA